MALPKAAGAHSRFSLFTSPLLAGLVALATYTVLTIVSRPPGSAWDYRLGQSYHAYFIYLANGFLNGQLSLVDLPASTHDLIFYNGRYYLYWPPFPAVLFMPLVAVFGVGVSDVPLTLAVAALNVSLVALLLRALDRRGIARLPAAKRAWLTAGFALGTVHLFLAAHSSVWFTAQLVGFALCAAAYLAALALPARWAPIVAGSLLACAFLTRTPLVFAGIWIAWFLWSTRDRADPAAVPRLAMGLLLLLGGPLLLAAYNYARFGNPLELGLAYQQWDPVFVADLQRYGAFSLHYLPVNLFYNFVAFPYLALYGPEPDLYLWMGGSLFLMSPVFVLALYGIQRCWRRQGWVLLVTIVLGLLPMLLVLGTGYKQFGPRYTLDVTVPLLLATAIGAARIPTRWLSVLVLIGIILYLPGTIWYGIWGRP